jgi:hypothetical protein
LKSAAKSKTKRKINKYWIGVISGFVYVVLCFFLISFRQ